MPPKRLTKSFNKTVIVLDKALPNKDRQDLERWLRHAGAKIKTELADEVTHFVVDKSTWLDSKSSPESQAMLTAARKQRTIFLVCKKWIKDSLSFNKKKPIYEVDRTYTWDIKHAERVWDKRDQRCKEVRKQRKQVNHAKLKAAAVASKKRSRELEDNEDDACTNGKSINVDGCASDESKKQKKARKLKDLTACGLVYDRRLLEFEREQAMDGYRPYVDDCGNLYMITMIRDNVAKAIKERYEVKLPQNSDTLKLDSDVTWTDSISDDLLRFAINENAEAHYLDDKFCCQRRPSSKNSASTYSSGTVTPSSTAYDAWISSNCSIPSVVMTALEAPFEYWEPHLPFSVHPIISYTRGPASPCMQTPEQRPSPRVHIDDHIAYSLQLYESYDRPSFPSKPAETMPQRNLESYTSFKSLLPQELQPEAKRPSTVERSISPPGTPPHATEETPNRKQYRLVVHYTTRQTRNSLKTEDLVPRRSGKDQGRDDLAYAMDIWTWFFNQKTKMKWNDIVAGKHAVACRRDSGVSLPDDMNIESSSSIRFNVKPPAITPSKPEPDAVTAKEAKDKPLALQDISQDYTRQPFRYIPNQSKHIARIAKHYKDHFEEEWLHVDMDKLKFHSQEEALKVVAESKPAFQICDDPIAATCDCGQVEEKTNGKAE